MVWYEGVSMIKTFRGLIADGAQDTVVLHTTDGSTGYRIVKLEIMSQEPYGGANSEHLVQIWTEPQTTIDGNVDFSDQTLLGSAIINNATSGYSSASVPVIIFDNQIFNQDIFITHHEGHAAQACNYHLELEQIKLDLNENTVATLKDIRNSA